MTTPGWGAVVQGESADLADWANTLKQPFDPWVEMHGKDMVLRSSSLDNLPTAIDVRDQAIAHIERLNGAVALSQGAKPLLFGGVIEIAPDGQLHRTMFLEAALYEDRDRFGAIGTVLGVDGKASHPGPQPSEVQIWTEIAEDDDLLDDALIYFGRSADWFDIYKALESLIMKFGGEGAFVSKGWAPADEITRLKRTANAARHAKRKYKPQPNPMNVNEARLLLGQLLRRAFGEAKKSTNSTCFAPPATWDWRDW
jgi:hypothetical protein